MFSGYVIKKNLNNDIIEKKGYLNGYLEGKSVGYFDNGKLKFKRYYHSGKKSRYTQRMVYKWTKKI